MLDAIERGPIDPGQAQRATDVNVLLNPAALPGECGWCVLPDGCGYVAMRTEMPGVTGEMIDWWFDWHPHDPIRYRIWHPLAHESNSVDAAVEAGEKPYWGTVHHPVEDIGIGTVHARIAFHRPEVLGFSAGALDQPDVAAIVGGFAGDDRRRMQHTKMIHVFLRSNGGVVLRSRFWLGAALRPYAPSPLAELGARLLNRSAVRRRLIPAAAPRALARHCAEEYTNLAALLPELYEQFATPDRV
jgi:phloretin hydrolase